MKNDSQQEERLVWRLKEKQILYDERWLHLESRSYQLADGTVIEPYYVTCPNDFTVIVAVTENGSFLMERLYQCRWEPRRWRRHFFPVWQRLC